MKFLATLFGSQASDAKTLEQSRAQLASAKASAEVVAALFTTAGLDLDAMIEAGPDSLKAHLTSLSAKDVELAAAQAKVTELEGKNATLTADLNSATIKFSTVGSALAPLGISATTKPDEYAALVSAHVKKEAALELAKTGHAPVADVPPPPPGKTQAIDPTLTGADRTRAFFASKLTSKK